MVQALNDRVGVDLAWDARDDACKRLCFGFEIGRMENKKEASSRCNLESIRKR